MYEGEIYYLNEEEHELEVKDYIYSNLSVLTQKKAMSAIKELLENGKDGTGIHYALNKKSPKQWEKFGFGLLFNGNFDASVGETIKRDKKLEEIDYEEVEKGLKQEEKTNEKLENNIDIEAAFGYNRNGAQKYNNESIPGYTMSSNGKLRPYIPVEELTKENKNYEGRPHDLLSSLLDYNAANQAYYDYEMARLEAINHQN